MKFSSLNLLLLIPFASSSSLYKSRPDLSPPVLNITHPSTSPSTGYIFIAPYASTTSSPEQPGAYIFRDDGDLVWSSLGYYSGFVANFQVGKLSGRDVLQAFEGIIDVQHGHGYGHVSLWDGGYKRVGEVRGGGWRLADLHEFKIVHGGKGEDVGDGGETALIEIYQQTVKDLSEFGGGKGQVWIVDGIFQELDIETGKILFEWSSLDHVSPQDTYISLNESGYTSRDSWDYFHINSVDKGPEGHYLISARHTSTIYKINGTDGSIIWQLGGKNSTFTLGEGVHFGFQHDARFLSSSTNDQIETISLFDNSAYSQGHIGDGNDKLNPWSSGKYIQLNHTSSTATLLKSVIHPNRVLAASQGNVQTLPNGNLFVNWGQAGSVTEFGVDGEVVFNAYLGGAKEGIQSYRGFRYEWEGRSLETPAVYVEEIGGDKVGLWVSWNGDTEVSVWRFLAGEEGRKSGEVLLGEVERTGFETSLQVERRRLSGVGSNIFIEAVDRNGEVISRTSVSCPLGIEEDGSKEPRFLADGLFQVQSGF